jgi:ABC-type Na+ efflux pump permease subunit
MISLKNIFIQAKFEVSKPLRSKASIFAIFLVFLTFLLISFSLSSFSGGESIPIGEYKIFNVEISASGSNSSELEIFLLKELSNYPRFNVRNSDKNKKNKKNKKSDKSDLNVLVENGSLRTDSRANSLLKSKVAEEEVSLALREIKRKYLENEIGKNESLRYILNPIWISFRDPEELEFGGFEEEGKGRRGWRREEKEVVEELESKGEEEGKVNITSPPSPEHFPIPKDAIPPEKIEIPFLFSQILSSFVIIAPIFFFTLFFAASIMREKIRKKGTYLLASPIKPSEIILGKLLPYLFTAIIISTITSFFMEKFSFWILLTIVPLTLALMGISLISALLSRNPEDLNFTLLFVNLVCFAYLFYPAMFSGIHSISLISPITAMIQGAEGSLQFWNFIWILVPISLLAIISLSFGSQLFKDEVLFAQRSFLDNIYEGFSFLWIEKIGKFKAFVASFFSGVVLIPLIYLIELGFLFLLFPLGNIVLYLLLPLSALIEEIGKILGIGAFLRKNLISKEKGWFYGALSGLGFFLIEKTIAITYFGFLTNLGAIFLLSQLGIALIIHILCSGISGYGLSITKGEFSKEAIKFLGIAIVIHAIFNFWIMWWFL